MRWRKVLPILLAASFVLGVVCYAQRDVPPEQRVRNAQARTRAEWGKLWGCPVFIRIIKEDKQLELWVQREEEWQIAKTFRIITFGGETEPKEAEGDGRAPEGFYRVRSGQLKPGSDYHLAFNIGYPNAYDRRLGRTGSFIMVHGSWVSIGCFAMGDDAIEEIYTMVDQALRAGQKYVPVQIYPFRMTPQRMETEKDSPYIQFWQHLEKGLDSYRA